MSDRSAIEWTDATCRKCGHRGPASDFPADRRTECKSCKNARARGRYQRRPALRFGPPPAAPRDGDKRQARKRVNQLVLSGKLPRPGDLPCADCGHVGADRRHEYDHYRGYAAEHHLAVQAVCSVCHHRREEERGEVFWRKRHVG